MRQVAYNTLRTQEQLGYVVFCSPYLIHTMLGGAITIHSPKKDPEFLTHRINTFLDTQKERVNNLSDEEFEKFRDSALAKKTVKDVSLAEAANRAWNEVYDQLYKFDRQDKQIQALRDITKQELIHYYNELFWDNCRRVNIKVICKKHREEVDDQAQECNQKWYAENSFEVRAVDPSNLKEFHSMQDVLDF